jgi:hypothetical protein
LEHSTAKTPIATEHLLKTAGQATQWEIRDYQEKVGSCNYPAVITRPDIAYTTQKLSEHLQNPSRQHINAANRCNSYLNTTKDSALEYGGDIDAFEPRFESVSEFEGYSDSSFADDVATRRSTRAHKIDPFNCAVD